MTEMPSSAPANPTARTLDVPGARLHYEVRGSGPLLLIIGAPMGSVFFIELADQFVADRTVLTYDPRGISRSTLTGPAGDDTPDTRAEDVRQLIEAVGGGPVDVFGSSGGAMTGLALVQRYPALVRTLVAHEPPLIDVLPDAEEQLAWGRELHRTWREEGQEAAFGKFLAGAGLGSPLEPGADGDVADGPGEDVPPPVSIEEMRGNNDYFFGHMVVSSLRYAPDGAALRAASTRVVIGAGSSRPDQLTYRTSVATAELLGTSALHFPGDHGGFLSHTEEFAAVLRRALDG